MSYSKTQRKKVIRKFKKAFGDGWQPYFRKYIKEIMEEKFGPPIGTLQEIMEGTK